MVSVIIPCFNSAKTIKRTLLSVVQQTYKNYEIIIVDDGSTDSTKKAIEAFFENLDISYKYIYQVNSGPSKARNVGIFYSQGEYIAFLDSDDQWHPQKIELQIRMMKRLNVKISGTRHNIISKKDIVHENSNDYLSYNNIQVSIVKWPKILFISPFATPSVVIHTSLKNYLFDESIRYSEDYNLWKRITYKHKAIKLLLPLTYTFKHDYITLGTSLSTNLKKMQIGVNDSFLSLLKSKRIALKYKPILMVAFMFSQIKYIRRLLKSHMKNIRGKNNNEKSTIYRN